jgi:hypothetical protein
MKKVNSFLILIMFGFVMMAQNTHAGDVNAAPDLTQDAPGIQHNARIAIAPYAQVVANDSYTFIGISHPSLATAHTSIGVVVEAMNMTTVPNTKAGRAAIFTVSAGETHRVFVINQSHATINANNASFTDTQTHLITVTDASQFGNIRVIGVDSHPYGQTLDTVRPGRYSDTAVSATASGLYRHANLNQLSMWGVVYQTSNGAGFAMEFVGDMHDSSVAGVGTVFPVEGFNDLATGINLTPGRGIN